MMTNITFEEFLESSFRNWR